MRTLVTGAGGFVGSHVVRNLLDHGAEVAVILRTGTSHPRLDGITDRLTVIDGELGAAGTWREALADWRPDACIHTAWYAEPGKYLDSDLNLAGLRFSLELLELLARAGCKHLVMTGTCFEYDTSLGFLQEDGPARPLTLYAACKHALSVVARQRAAQLGVSFAWGRIFYLYGPFEDPRRVVPALMLAAIKGQEFLATKVDQVRDYMHVADVAAGLCALAEKGCDGVFNVCSGEPVTMARLILTAGEIMGRSDLIRLGARPPAQFDPPFIAGDNRRLREATGWAPVFDLESGLRETAGWWRAHAKAGATAGN